MNNGSAKIVVILLALAVVLGVGYGVMRKGKVNIPVQNEPEGVMSEVGFSIISPVEGSVWKVGETHIVSWKNAPKVFGIDIETAIDDPVKRSLFSVVGGDVEFPSSGSYQWTIPSAIPPGSYRMVLLTPQIGESGMKMSDRSQAFTIVAP